MPALQEAKPLVQKQVLHEMRVERSRGTKEELHKVYGERVKKNVRHLIRLDCPPLYKCTFLSPDDCVAQRALR